MDEYIRGVRHNPWVNKAVAEPPAIPCCARFEHASLQRGESYEPYPVRPGCFVKRIVQQQYSWYNTLNRRLYSMYVFSLLIY